MAFLRTLFWIALTVVVVVFSLRNWVPVTINLFGNLQADVKLPVLLLFFFLLGFVPLYAWHRATRWRHGRALAAERLATPVPPPPPPLATPPLPTESGIAPARAD
jgi:uncharacterized integral membrane protein